MISPLFTTVPRPRNGGGKISRYFFFHRDLQFLWISIECMSQQISRNITIQLATSFHDFHVAWYMNVKQFSFLLFQKNRTAFEMELLKVRTVRWRWWRLVPKLSACLCPILAESYNASTRVSMNVILPAMKLAFFQRKVIYYPMRQTEK